MSNIEDETFTINELKIMNSGEKYNGRIIIHKNANENIKWRIKYTWEDSGSLDGKYYKIVPAYWRKMEHNFKSS